MLVIVRFQNLCQLSCDVFWQAEVKASHFLDHFLVQWQLQGFTLREVVLRRIAEALVHPGVAHDFGQAGTLLGISDQHA
jgi:hypothetical protein